MHSVAFVLAGDISVGYVVFSRVLMQVTRDVVGEEVLFSTFESFKSINSFERSEREAYLSVLYGQQKGAKTYREVGKSTGRLYRGNAGQFLYTAHLSVNREEI